MTLKHVTILVKENTKGTDSSFWSWDTTVPSRDDSSFEGSRSWPVTASSASVSDDRVSNIETEGVDCEAPFVIFLFLVDITAFSGFLNASSSLPE